MIKDHLTESRDSVPAQPAQSRIKRAQEWLTGRWGMWASIGVLGLMVLAAVAAPLLTSYNPELRAGSALRSPSWQHLFGTDELGRDIFSRVLFGTRASVAIAVGTVLIAGTLGTLAGLVAGYFADWRDSVLMRIADFLLGFPALILALIAVAIFGAGRLAPLVAAVIVCIPLFGRVVRASTLGERNKEYVMAAKAMGANSFYVLVNTILPAIFPVVLVQSAIAAALAIQLEAALSFLGAGVPPPAPSLGSMLQSAHGFLFNSPLYGVFPGVALTILVGALVTLANALESAESVNVTELEMRSVED